jgi:branched-chain amino acid transport system substrate-binding protein
MATRRDLLRGAAAAAAATSFPSIALSATGKPTVRIGFLDSFSGVFSDVAGKHKIGASIALADLNRRGGVRYELVTGDDTSKPAVATTEMRRLAGQESVDVIFGGTSSGSALALAPLADELGIFNLTLGPFDTNVTGAKARQLTYRYGLNSRMALRPMANRLLALGKKWYFVQADYALGKDAYAQLSPVLLRAGGTEAGHDVLPLGTTDFSSSMTKVQTSGADVLVLANSGVDAANAVHAFVQFGLQKKIHLAGINLEDYYFDAVPLDAIQGATFSVLWAPDVSDASRRLVARLKREINGPISARHYYGYAALMQLADRIEAAGTTDAAKLAKAFNDHSFEGYKENKSRWKGCDHQNAQDSYAGAVVSRKQFDRTQFMFDIVATVPTDESDGSCETPWAKAATASIAASTIGSRPGYTPKAV